MRRKGLQLRWRLVLLVAVCLILPGGASCGEAPAAGSGDLRRGAINPICLNPVGVVRSGGEHALLEIFPQFGAALEGLGGFSHVWVFYWFHEHDRPDERQTLKVHPRRDPSNPLTGVFATRAPVRPNLIGLTACRIIGVEGNILKVADLDAKEGSPILDLKPYIPQGDALPAATVPAWVKNLKSSK